MSFFGFHPLIERWFYQRFEAPTEPQEPGWRHIAAGANTLIAAPTGSGKTLTAFLAIIDRLLKESIAGRLEDGMRVVYVSPLRALSNDMHHNLSVPLNELNALAAEEFPGVPIAELRAGLRTGDTTASQRAALVRKPPHILVTTPESLFLLLTAERGRDALKSVDTVIVDEIHALIRDKRGSHLSLSLERLQEHTGRSLQRIGLSATQKPIDRVAEFLVGSRNATQQSGLPDDGNLAEPDQKCRIVDVGHARTLDLKIVTPPSELSAVCSNEQWAEVNEQIVDLIGSHRSTLIFVNTRRLAERVTHQLSEILGEEQVSSHHGSIASDRRLETERRLKAGQLKAVVATASLELGLDVGFIDLVIQVGSPRSIATFLQRVGRSGHSLGRIPRGRLLALTRDELLECMALIRAVRSGRLDGIPVPENPVDVLAQQIVAEVACREWETDQLFDVCRRAWPFRNLKRHVFDETLHFLSEGLTDRTGRGRVYIHHDMVQRRVRSRPGARIVATSNAGAIPDVGLFRVVTEDGTVVGTLDEDFAIESHSGQIFLLGNTSWRIQHVRGMDVTVTDAGGAPPTIPFWRGEAPGRTLELSREISCLREQLEARVKSVPEAVIATWWDAEIGLPDSDPQGVETTETPESKADTSDQQPAGLVEITHWLAEETSCAVSAARQTVLYVAAQVAAVGVVPTQRRVIFERFFDESGGMQMVVHAPFGSRITQAWGLAMRKRFCRSFDFELQATADDNGFILSLGPQHSFPLESMFGMLNPENVRACVEQAVLYIPMFQIRWRWNTNRALLVPRRDKGKKIPPNLQRFRADDLLTSVFPLLTGCQENVVGELTVPDHVLVQQTMHDCLTEALDIEGLEGVLAGLQTGQLELIARDTREPSPFSYQLLNSNPYSFLDGGELAERRARAVSTRRSLSVESVTELGRLDPLAIDQVVRDATPLIRNADELHDVLLTRVVLPVGELTDENLLAQELFSQKRATRLRVENSDDSRDDGSAGGVAFEALVAAERLPAALAMFPDAVLNPPITAPAGVRTEWNSVDAGLAAVRGLMEISGPLTAVEVSRRTGMTSRQASGSLEALEGEGFVLRGKFSEGRRGVEQSTSPGPRDQSESGKPVRTSEARSGQEGSSIDRIEHPDGKSPGAVETVRDSTVEWCHRRLLARIHRLTMDGLRRQIQPVTPEVFMKFLAEHHGLIDSHRRAGPDGLFEVISLLQGLDLPASSWEEWILPGRVQGYRPEWLDELCLTGEVGWNRLFPPRRAKDSPAMLSKNVPVSLFLRTDVDWLTAWKEASTQGVPTSREPLTNRTANLNSDLVDSAGTTSGELAQTEAGPGNAISPAAQRIRVALSAGGALFAADLMSQCGLARGELNQALGELIALGLVTADGFGGLRDLAGGRRKQRSGVVLQPGLVRQRHSTGGTGRWSLSFTGRVSEIDQNVVRQEVHTPLPGDELPRSDSESDRSRPDSVPLDDPVEQWAWQLLRRWGVVFRDLLQRESGAPRWWELLQVYRRLEARGEIRGGRFISGVAGEQFGLGETVRKLRQIRDASTRPKTKTRALRHAFLDAMRSGDSGTEIVPEDAGIDVSRRQKTDVVALPGGVVEKKSLSDRKPTPELLVLSAADPLNLIGIVTEHARVPCAAHNRIVLLDGCPVAAVQNGETVMLVELPVTRQDELQRLLARDSRSISSVSGGAGDDSSADTDGGRSEPPDAPPELRKWIRPVIS